tara:strand:+ start:444 stop:683 length:240 start_codon:yes stop_codon:yes gene_type:complete
MEINVDFVIVNDEEMPPLMVTPNDDDEVKVVLNAAHRTWLALHRKTVGGLGEPVFDKIDFLLQAWLEEQRAYEKSDGEY